MSTPQEIQRNVQFNQLLFGLENLNEALVQSSSQLGAIASQLLNMRQHLSQLKSLAPAPDHPGYPAKTDPVVENTVGVPSEIAKDV